MVQIDRMGGGVSQAIGTGGRDLKEAVGGIMMLSGIKALAADEGTDVIVLVSKPPAESVSAKIFGLLETLDKPAVVCFLEGDTDIAVPSHVHVRDNLFDAAVAAVAASRGEAVPEAGASELDEGMLAAAAEARAKLNADQRNLRAFFCGGTLCAEAVFLLRSRLDALRSNVSHRPSEEMSGSDACVGNVLLDMGDDEFTNGRPHPMIEPALRNDIIAEQGSDPTVAWCCSTSSWASARTTTRSARHCPPSAPPARRPLRRAASLRSWGTCARRRPTSRGLPRKPPCLSRKASS